MKRKICYGYSGHKNLNLLEEAKQVHEKMKIEPALTFFTGLQGQIMLLGAEIDKFEASCIAEKTTLNLAIRDEDRRILIDRLVSIALIVSEQANGHEVKLSSTGYKLVKLRGSNMDLPIEAPKNFRVTNYGSKGQAKLRCDPVLFAITYESEYNLTPGSNSWIRMPLVSNSQRHFTPHLPSATEVAFRMRGIGLKGPGDWSYIVLLVIL